MSLTRIGIFGILILVFILFIFGIPVGFAMGLVGFIGFAYVMTTGAGVNMLATVTWDTFSN